MRWGRRFEPEGTGTRVTHRREHIARPNLLVTAAIASGLPGRERERLMVEGMHRALAALEAHAEAARPPAA